MLIAHKKEEYVTVLSDGTLRLVVPEGTEGAVKREYETSTGEKGVKYELVFNTLVGHVTGVAFHDGDFGKLLQLTVNDGKGDMILSLSTATNFGEDVMKKLPNIDFTKECSFSPFSFTNEKGKSVKGVSIVQEGEKIKNFFQSTDPEIKEPINGYPKAKGDTTKYSKDKWKIYFLEAREFLTEYIEENVVKGYFKTASTIKAVESGDFPEEAPFE